MDSTWDPALYERFRAERAQPFHDLLARVRRLEPGVVADLGCGTCALTRHLRERWPAARVHAVDRSPEMLRKGAESGHTAGIEVACGDLMEWSSPEPIDLLISNATLHWLPDHATVLARLAGLLAPGGSLAVQVPRNEEEPAYRVMLGLLAEEPWRGRFSVGELRPGAERPEFYEQHLDGLGLDPVVWETIYRHRLDDAAAILDWLRGAALRPFLSRLDPRSARRFERQLGDRLRDAYGDGTVVFRFRRLFFTAHRRQRTGSARPAP